MAAIILGPIVYFIVLAAADIFLAVFLGSGAFIWAYILAFIVWLWTYKVVFGTGWLGALGITMLALIVLVSASLLLEIPFGGAIPNIFSPQESGIVSPFNI